MWIDYIESMLFHIKALGLLSLKKILEAISSISGSFRSLLLNARHKHLPREGSCELMVQRVLFTTMLP